MWLFDWFIFNFWIGYFGENVFYCFVDEWWWFVWNGCGWFGIEVCIISIKRELFMLGFIGWVFSVSCIFGVFECGYW